MHLPGHITFLLCGSWHLGPENRPTRPILLHDLALYIHDPGEIPVFMLPFNPQTRKTDGVPHTRLNLDCVNGAVKGQFLPIPGRSPLMEVGRREQIYQHQMLMEISNKTLFRSLDALLGNQAQKVLQQE